MLKRAHTLLFALFSLLAWEAPQAYIASSPFGVQTSQSCSAAGGSGCGAGNTGRQTRVNSLDAQYQSRDRAQLTRATVGEGTVLVRRDGETGTDSRASLNREWRMFSTFCCRPPVYTTTYHI
ncbi:MAG: hypothetical protein AB1450_11900 [Pseudomonadota bacterium]